MTAPNSQALADAVETGAIKALSIKQPYPHHIFHDGKDVENRDWPTRYRGWVIVHAGKTTDGPTPKALGDLPKGGVVGMMRITDCVEQLNSKWFFGRYGFVISESFALPLIPCRGMLSFFPLDQATRRTVADSIRKLGEGA